MELKEVRERYDVGVIVGRFQVPDLHDAHRALIQHVCDEHDKVVIFLGLSPLMVTRENPLDFEARKQMLLEEFPDVNVLYIKDQRSDEIWSKKLDEMISDVVTPSQSVVLYGGRDSFIRRYHGKHFTRELEQDQFISGTVIRKGVGKRKARNSADFRAGVVWAAQSRFPTAFTCVDIAIFNEDSTEILLAKKENEPLLRLIGGFSDPTTETFELDAKREVSEEAHIEISDPQYVASFLVDDWRYNGEEDKIKTMLFTAKHLFGAPQPDDDISELHWIPLGSLDIEFAIMPNHRPLVSAAINQITQQRYLDAQLRGEKVKAND